MTFSLEMTCDNDAFADDMPGEIARILSKLAAEIAERALYDGDDGRMRDANGNTVGRWLVMQ